MILSRRSIFIGIAAVGALIGLGIPVMAAPDPLPLDPHARLAHLRRMFLRRAQALESWVWPLRYSDPSLVSVIDTVSTVDHPLLLEAVIRFQANVRGEMLPASGPVKFYEHHQILGKGNTAIEAIDDWYASLPQGRFERVIWRTEPEFESNKDYDTQIVTWRAYSRMAGIPAMEAA